MVWPGTLTRLAVSLVVLELTIVAGLDLDWTSYSDRADLPMSQQWREEMRGKLSRVDTSTLSPEKKRQFQALWARLSDEPTGGGVFDSLPLENLMVPLLVVAGVLILWVQNGAAPAKVSGSQLGGAASGSGTVLSQEAREARLRRFNEGPTDGTVIT